jgi:hypothetical protein
MTGRKAQAQPEPASHARRRRSRSRPATPGAGEAGAGQPRQAQAKPVPISGAEEVDMDGTVAMDALPAEEPALTGPPQARQKEDTSPPWAPPDVPGTTVGALLDRGEETSWAALFQRLGAALALSAAFGIALGMRAGGLGLPRHGAGVPLGLAVVALIVAPAFLIGLLHIGLRISAQKVADALSRAAAASGLMLAALAPLAALVVVTSETGIWAAAFGWLGLSLAGALGLRQLARDLAPLLAAEPAGRRFQAWSAATCFGLVSALLAARVWAAALPVLEGGAP